jgi:selenocysteine-specific elongation factor
VTGAGTVVTGTLPAGTLRVGDELVLGGHDGNQTVRIRGLQTLKQQVDEVSGVARVAVNLRGSRLADKGVLARGVALLAPNAWPSTSVIDVALDDEVRAGEYTLHIGSAAVRARLRPLGSYPAARLTLSHHLPLRIGDHALLRDPSLHKIISAARVRDIRPRPFHRRGAAKARGAELMADGIPDTATLLRWHGIVRRDEMIAMGISPAATSPQKAWLIDPDYRAQLAQQLADLVAAHTSARPGDGGIPVAVASRELGLPAEEVVTELIGGPLAIHAGRIIKTGVVSARVAAAIAEIRNVLVEAPFQAPDAQWLADRAIDRKIIAAAEREGALVHLSKGVVLLAESLDRAVDILGSLGGPFTVSQARRALETTRRVAVPLLEYLDRQGRTERIDATTRRVAQPHSE